MQWPKSTVKSSKLQKSQPWRGDSPKVGTTQRALTHAASSDGKLHDTRRGVRARLCLLSAVVPSRTGSYHHLIQVAYFSERVLYLEKSYCFDLYGSWKLLLICNSFPMCLKISKWWNICIYIREDTVMALLWVHPSILLHIAGDDFERKKMSMLPHFLWYLTECITDPNWDHYFQMSTDSGCFIGL